MKKINKIIVIILILGLFSPITTLALSKKETIYTTIDYNGKVNKTFINNHLYLEDKGVIEDETNLKNIMNINGDEKFKLDGNKLTWNSLGRDIFYRGKTNKELPLSIKTTYYLNGKKMNPKKMVGKKGNIEIRFKFINNSYSTEDNMYLPLVVTVGTMFNDKENYNIDISNGKAVDTGTRTMAIGIASPGLYENTNISEFSNFDKTTIKYDTTNFKLSNIYIIATPKVLDSSDLNIFSKIDSLYSAVDKLNTSMDKIDNGSKELTKGIGSAKEGTSKLNNGSKQIDDGLKQIINELNNVSSSMSGGSGSIDNLIMLKQNNTNAINNLTTTNQTIANNFTSQGLDINLTEQQLIEILTNLGKDEATINSLVSYKRTYEGNKSLIYLLTKNNEAIDGTIQSSKETATKINTLITKLKEALMKLEYGTSSLNNGINELDQGMNKLYDGSNTLSKGISKFNIEGIKKIVSYSNKFKVYTNKAKRVLNKSREYKGFGSNNATRTTFVYKMKSIK